MVYSLYVVFLPKSVLVLTRERLASYPFCHHSACFLVSLCSSHLHSDRVRQSERVLSCLSYCDVERKDHQVETHGRLLQRYQTDGEPVRYGGTDGALSAPQRLLPLCRQVDCDDVDRNGNSDRRTTRTTFGKLISYDPALRYTIRQRVSSRESKSQ